VTAWLVLTVWVATLELALKEAARLLDLEYDVLLMEIAWLAVEPE
jgi:hypothetical protein